MSDMIVGSVNKFDISIYNKFLSEQKNINITDEEQDKNYNAIELYLNNRDENIKRIQEMADFLAASKEEETDDVEADDNAKANNAETIKQLLYQVLIKAENNLSNLAKFDPVSFIMELFGAEPKIDDITNDDVTGRDFIAAYEKFFEKFKYNSSKSYGASFIEGFNLIPNLISTGLTNSLKDEGYEMSEDIGYVPCVGSVISGIDNNMSTVGKGISTFVGTIYNLNNNAVDENKFGMLNTTSEKYTKFKDIAFSTKYKALEIAKDCKDMVTYTIKKALNLITKCKEDISAVASNICEAISFA